MEMNEKVNREIPTPRNFTVYIAGRQADVGVTASSPRQARSILAKLLEIPMRDVSTRAPRAQK
jgi:hypothetical protein